MLDSIIATNHDVLRGYIKQNGKGMVHSPGGMFNPLPGEVTITGCSFDNVGSILKAGNNSQVFITNTSIKNLDKSAKIMF